MRIVLLGAPGSGKRTQTKLLVERYRIPPIATGELLKAAVTSESALGQQVKMALDEGHSVSEEVVLELIRERLLLPDARDGFILDGFPRNILQAITLDEVLAEIDQPIDLSLMIHIETDALMERLVGRRTCKSCDAHYNIFNNPTAVEGVCDLCGGGLRHRADDNEETISSRLHVYDHLASALIKHYTKQQKLKIVDGFGEVQAVFDRICQIVDSHEVPGWEPPQTNPGLQAALGDAMAETPQPLTPAPAAETALPADPEPAPTHRLVGNNSEAELPAGKKKAPGKQKAEGNKASNKRSAKNKILKKTTTGKKPVAGKAVAKKKKLVAKKQVSVVKKKGPVKRKPGVKKAPVRKKPAVKGQAAAKKRTVAGKKVAVKKPLSKKKTSKKKTAKPPVAARKKAGSQKKVVNKSVASKSKRAAVKKPSGKKKTQSKKPQAKKRPAAKKTHSKR